MNYIKIQDLTEYSDHEWHQGKILQFTKKHMYSNSFAFIKQSGHMKRKFRIMMGTEQSHPRCSLTISEWRLKNLRIN